MIIPITPVPDPSHPTPITPPLSNAPVTVVATHEELLRSARDLWAVAVSLLTELTPDKFATAPWAAALFVGELPFLLAKLWHIQQGVITSAHSYMQNESSLTTFLETIDVPKLLSELSPWVTQIAPLLQGSTSMVKHVPAVEVDYPSSVEIIQKRFIETTWSDPPLLRHESYQMPNGTNQHWFYLPKHHGWSVFNAAQVNDNFERQLDGFVNEITKPNDEVLFVGMSGGELLIPTIGNYKPEGEATVYKFLELQDS
jgi:hypothetical protein